MRGRRDGKGYSEVAVPGEPRRLGIALLGSFTITIACFLASAWVADRQAGGLLDSAEDIVADAVPAIRHLDHLRTTLEELSSNLSVCVEQEQATCSVSRVDALRWEAKSEWHGYLILPPFAGERERWPVIARGLDRIDVSVADVLSALKAHDSPRAKVIFWNARSEFDRVDEQIGDLIDFNAQSAISLGNRVLSLNRRSRHWEVLLYAGSAIFGVVAALAALQLVRRYSSLMQRRISELEHFTGRVAHDVRSPLASVGLALDIAEHSTGDPKVSGVLSRGSRTLLRVGQLVDGLLVFAHSAARPSEGARSSVAAAIRGVVEDMLPLAAEKDIELLVERVDEGEVSCSDGVLTSLLSNLLGNAVKYMGDSPVRRVTLRARRANARMRIEIEDTGPGVPEELRARIFDPYVRGTGSNEPGFGLGLATVRRLTEAHGGAVGVEPREPGSTFWFELPAARRAR